MNRKLNHHVICAVVLFVFLSGSIGLSASGSMAQDYPNKPISIIVGFTPGGGTDFVARLVAQKLTEKWGQPVVVDNKPGGSGVIAAKAGAGAKPDGYTLYAGTAGHMVLTYSLFDNYPIHPLKDLVPVTNIARNYFILVVHPSVPARSVKEFVALAKSKPGHFNFSSPGIGTLDHLIGEIFQIKTGIKMVHVPYKGSGESLAALLSGGEVSVAVMSEAAASPQIKAGKLRGLAITAPVRSQSLPDLPTMPEAGVPDLVEATWNGLFAPIGTPKEIVTKLNSEIHQILLIPDVIQRLSSLGLVPASMTPEDFSAMIKDGLEKWGKLITNLGIQRQHL